MQSIHPAITLFPYTSPLLTSATHPCPAPQHSITPRSPPPLSPTPAPFYHLQHPSISTRGEPPACRPPRSPAYLARPENPASCLPNAATPPSHHPPFSPPPALGLPRGKPPPPLTSLLFLLPARVPAPCVYRPESTRQPSCISPPERSPPHLGRPVSLLPTFARPAPHQHQGRTPPPGPPPRRPRIGSPAAGASPRLSIAANPLYHLHHPHPALAALPRGKTPRPAVARLTPPATPAGENPSPRAGPAPRPALAAPSHPTRYSPPEHPLLRSPLHLPPPVLSRHPAAHPSNPPLPASTPGKSPQHPRAGPSPAPPEMTRARRPVLSRTLAPANTSPTPYHPEAATPPGR